MTRSEIKRAREDTTDPSGHPDAKPSPIMQATPCTHGRLTADQAKGLKELRSRIHKAHIPSSRLDETLLLATWNIREFGRRKRNQRAFRGRPRMQRAKCPGAFNCPRPRHHKMRQDSVMRLWFLPLGLAVLASLVHAEPPRKMHSRKASHLLQSVPP
jgi:hypothetical protein